MKGSSKAGAIIGGVVVILVIAAALELYALSNIQFRSQSADSFDFADLSMDVSMEVCNPTFMPTSFNQINADFNYKSTRIGTFYLDGTSLPSKTAIVTPGRINIDGMSVMQIILGGMLGSLAGQGQSYNENDFNVDLEVKKSIFFIPFTYEKKIRASEIQSFLEGRSSGWGCNSSGQFNVFEQVRIDAIDIGFDLDALLEQSQNTVDSTINEINVDDFLESGQSTIDTSINEIDIDAFFETIPSVPTIPEEEKTPWVESNNSLRLVIYNDFDRNPWDGQSMRIHGNLMSSKDYSPLVKYQVFLKDSITKEVLAFGRTDSSGEYWLDWKASAPSSIDNSRNLSVESGSLFVNLGEIIVR